MRVGVGVLRYCKVFANEAMQYKVRYFCDMQFSACWPLQETSPSTRSKAHAHSETTVYETMFSIYLLKKIKINIIVILVAVCLHKPSFPVTCSASPLELCI